MKRDNKTQYALLGVLTRHECSGYDIKKFIENSIGYFWQESFGQIYPNLKKMEKEGLIKSRTVSDKKPSGKKSKKTGKTAGEKTVYSITKKGQKKLTDWLKLPVENSSYRNELLLKLFFGRQMNARDIENHLSTKQLYLEKILNEYRAVQRQIEEHGYKSPDRPYWLMTLDFGIRAARAELDWIDSAKKNPLSSKKS